MADSDAIAVMLWKEHGRLEGAEAALNGDFDSELAGAASLVDGVRRPAFQQGYQARDAEMAAQAESQYEDRSGGRSWFSGVLVFGVLLLIAAVVVQFTGVYDFIGGEVGPNWPAAWAAGSAEDEPPPKSDMERKIRQRQAEVRKAKAGGAVQGGQQSECGSLEADRITLTLCTRADEDPHEVCAFKVKAGWGWSHIRQRHRNSRDEIIDLNPEVSSTGLQANQWLCRYKK